MNQNLAFSRDDATLISRLAEQLSRGSDTELDLSDNLTEMIGQATILPESVPAEGYVGLGEAVTYEVIATGDRHTVTVVAPPESDPKANRISVVTPVGLALIGEAVGASSVVVLPNGRTQDIRIVATHPDLLPAA